MSVALPRLRLVVEVFDNTDSITASMSDRAAKDFLGCDINTLVLNLWENHQPFQSIVHLIANCEIDIELRKFEASYSETKSEKFHVGFLRQINIITATVGAIW